MENQSKEKQSKCERCGNEICHEVDSEYYVGVGYICHNCINDVRKMGNFEED